MKTYEEMFGRLKSNLTSLRTVHCRSAFSLSHMIEAGKAPPNEMHVLLAQCDAADLERRVLDDQHTLKQVRELVTKLEQDVLSLRKRLGEDDS